MRRFGTQWKEMQTVARYILQRVGQTLLILLIVSFITYLLIDFLPGDPLLRCSAVRFRRKRMTGGIKN